MRRTLHFTGPFAVLVALGFATNAAAQGATGAPGAAEPPAAAAPAAAPPAAAPPAAPAPAAQQPAPAQPAPGVEPPPNPPQSGDTWEPKKNERTAWNAVYAELGGAALIYSVNYERLLIEELAIRLGVAYWSASSASLLLVPLQANLFLIGKNHKMEIGAGPVFASYSAKSDFIGSSASGFVVYGSGTLGWRYIPQHGGVNVGVALTPIFGNGVFVPWGGVKIGGVF
jgi:hypothetical protein